MPPAKLMPPTSAITATKPRPDSERCGVMIAEKSVGSAWRVVVGRGSVPSCWPQYRTIMAQEADQEAELPRRADHSQEEPGPRGEKGRAAARPPRSSRRRPRPRPTTRRCTATTKPWNAAEVEEAFRRFQAAMPEPKGELQSRQSVHAAGRGGAVGAGDRRRRQQGDAGAVRARRHAGEDGGARRGRRVARADQDHRAVPHQGEERHRAVAEAHRRARRQGAAARARRCRNCPASGARPPTSCSTSRSASRPWRSTPTSSASATAPDWRPARTRWRSS